MFKISPKSSGKLSIFPLKFCTLEDTLGTNQSVSPSLFCSIGASVVSLGVIIFLNTVNTVVAGLVTEFELPRTQQEFDDSYAFKE